MRQNNKDTYKDKNNNNKNDNCKDSLFKFNLVIKRNSKKTQLVSFNDIYISVCSFLTVHSLSYTNEDMYFALGI